jgi:hypothetical protein
LPEQFAGLWIVGDRGFFLFPLLLFHWADSFLKIKQALHYTHRVKDATSAAGCRKSPPAFF